MLTLKVSFPWGRYYAHPWGLNPARLREAEWPPSPWRLLRSIAAGWFRANRGATPGPELLALLEVLGQELPEIAIAPVSFAQTVHWQPNFGAADKDDKAAALYKRTRHENHFAATESPIFFCWRAVTLDETQRALLAEIIPHVTYFGRSESLCTLVLLDKDVQLPERGWCKPCLDSTTRRRIAEDCRDVFCPDPHDFQPADLWARRANRDSLDPDHAPPHLVEDLLSHQPLPDGARWISYQMPEGWPGQWIVRVPKSVRRLSDTPAPRVAHYLRFSLQCRIPIPLKFWTHPSNSLLSVCAMRESSPPVKSAVLRFTGTRRKHFHRWPLGTLCERRRIKPSLLQRLPLSLLIPRQPVLRVDPRSAELASFYKLRSAIPSLCPLLRSATRAISVSGFSWRQIYEMNESLIEPKPFQSLNFAERGGRDVDPNQDFTGAGCRHRCLLEDYTLAAARAIESKGIHRFSLPPINFGPLTKSSLNAAQRT